MTFTNRETKDPNRKDLKDVIGILHKVVYSSVVRILHEGSFFFVTVY